MEKKSSLSKSIAKKIALLRKQKGLTQVELGKKLDLSQRGIAYYEKEASTLNLDMLEKIACALDVNIEYFLKEHIENIQISKQDLDDIKKDKKLKKFYSLNKTNQQLVLKFINSLTKSRSV